jgi:hypothetical protein
MEIDMHFGGTYIVARLAGFSELEASTIANAAQYVDDANNSGFVRFKNGALFQRTTTVNKLASSDNLNDCSNHLAWLPFHFLPGNCGLPAGEGMEKNYVQRLICQANSHIAQDMVEYCIVSQQSPQKLHRLGITAHVFLDTFAHQKFGGFWHVCNWVGGLQGHDESTHKSTMESIEELFPKCLLSPLPMLGHVLASTYPDTPWLNWSYKNADGIDDSRKNPDIFMSALDELHRVFCRYRRASEARTPEEEGLTPVTADALRHHLTSITSESGEVRLAEWRALITSNEFGFGHDEASYVAKNWRAKALNNEGDFGPCEVFNDIPEIDYPADFLQSDWVLFHNAAKDHRHAVVQGILPRYGLCAA